MGFLRKISDFFLKIFRQNSSCRFAENGSLKSFFGIRKDRFRQMSIYYLLFSFETFYLEMQLHLFRKTTRMNDLLLPDRTKKQVVSKIPLGADISAAILFKVFNRERLSVSPDTLQIVKQAVFGVKHMDDNVPVIEKNPVRALIPLHLFCRVAGF